MKPLPTIYAVILNYNGFEDTKNCIVSLRKINSSNLKLNIIVVDNASTDGSYEKLKSIFPDLSIVVTEFNKGYTGGMNVGAKYALENGADYVLLSNNDMLYEVDFLEKLICRIESDQNIGIVSPKVLYMHNPAIIYCAGAEFKFSLGGSYNKYQGMLAKNVGNQVREISSAEGSCLLIKKDVFKKVGFYNEQFFIYFEDIEFSDRVRKFYKIFYEPESIVYHKTGAGLTWEDYSPFYYFYFTRNRMLYFSKYNFVIKFYGIVFSLANTIAKSIVLIKVYLLKKEKRKRIYNAFLSLWEGTFSGLKLVFSFSKKINNDNILHRSYR